MLSSRFSQSISDTTEKEVDYCRPSVIVERGGARIGIIGAIGSLESSISGEFNKGLDFISGSALTALVQNEAKRLREDEDCDIIVYSLHSDSDDYDYVLSNKNSGSGYVDVVFEGHTHSSYTSVDSYGVVHIQAGAYNEAMSCVSFSFDIISGDYSLSGYNIISSSVYGNSSIPDDGSIDELYSKYFPLESPYTEVLGYNDVVRSSSELQALVCQLYLEFGTDEWKDYNIILAGGKINTRTPGKLYAGKVTYADLFQLLPFDNSIILGKMKGSYVKSKFLNSNSLSYTAKESLNINSNEYYYIITDSYTAYYPSNNIEIIDTVENLYARDLLAAYVKDGRLGAGAKSSTVGEILSANVSGIHRSGGTVIATNTQSFLIDDGTGKILVYKGPEWSCDVSVGDKLTLEGSVGAYGGLLQFGKDTLYTKTGIETVTSPVPTEYSADDFNSLQTPFKPTLIRFTGTLSVSANSSGTTYYNIIIEGISRQGSISYPNADMAELLITLNSKEIDVVGYITSITGNNKYVNLIALSVAEHSQETPSPPEPGTLLTVAEASALGLSYENDSYTPEMYYVEGTVKEIHDYIYGTMTVQDKNGNTLYISRVNGDNGTRYDAMAIHPAVGDTVRLYGHIGKCDAQAQMINATLKSIVFAE